MAPAPRNSIVHSSSIIHPSSHPIGSPQESRLSENIVPDQSSDTETILSCLPCSFGEKAQCCYPLRLVDEDSSEGHQSSASLTKVEAAIMSEVADWWQSRYVDEFWMPRNKQQRLVWRTFNFTCGTCLTNLVATHCQPDSATDQGLWSFGDGTIDQR
jgi:hypothetical protein